MATTADQRLEYAESLFWAKEFDLALEAFEGVLAELPEGEEAFRVLQWRASCLREMGRDQEYVRALEELAERASGTRRGATSLMSLAYVFQRQAAHEKARTCWLRIVDDYSDLEPRLARIAQTHLDSPPILTFGPLGDRLFYRIDRSLELGFERLPLGPRIALALRLTKFVLQFTAFAVGFLLLLFLLLVPRAKPRPGPLFGKTWNVGRTCLLFLGVGLSGLLVGLMLDSLLEEDWIGFFFRLQIGPPLQLLPMLLGTIVVLRSESPERLYAWPVPRHRALLGMLVGLLAVWSFGRGLWLLNRWIDVELPWTRLSWGFFGSLPLVACLHLVVAVVEETMFRGALQQSLRRYVAPWAAILVTAVVFAGVHVMAPSNPLSALVLGLVAGYLVEHTGSLAPAILLHWVNNVVAELIA